MQPAILAIDQGTTRTKALVFDAQGRRLAESSSEVPLTYPRPGWVEQDPRIRDWDQDVLDALEIPRSILPTIQPSCSRFGILRSDMSGQSLPVTAALVDRQAALFGQACYAPGNVKVTYGTGAFILMNTGHTLPTSHFGLVPTVAWSLPDSINYALDGGIYVAGAAVQWLRDGLGIISSAEETYELALSVPDSDGVYFVPALAGLAAPYWDSYARGTIVGLTRGTTRAHIARATLEGIAYRTRDVLEAMAQDTGRSITSIKADGGASDNVFLMQALADISGVEVRVAATRETTALGAAFMAGLGAGLWGSQDELASLWHGSASYSPRLNDEIEGRYRQWLRAVERAKGWATPDAT